MDKLDAVVKEAVFGYAGGGANVKLFPLVNEELHVYAVNIIDYPIRKRPAAVVVIARVDGDKVIIEEDLTDRPLLDQLLHRGIPRSQIVLAYAGETPSPAIS